MVQVGVGINQKGNVCLYKTDWDEQRAKEPVLYI